MCIRSSRSLAGYPTLRHTRKERPLRQRLLSVTTMTTTTRIERIQSSLHGSSTNDGYGSGIRLIVSGSRLCNTLRAWKMARRKLVFTVSMSLLVLLQWSGVGTNGFAAKNENGHPYLRGGRPRRWRGQNEDGKVSHRNNEKKNRSLVLSTFCGNDGPYYGIVVDAASSGSRVRIFSWMNSTAPIVEVSPDERSREALFETTPGISYYRPYGDGDAGRSLSGLVSAAKTLIPQASWSITPMYVQATAGLRLLKPTDRRAVLDDVQRYLDDDRNCPFDVRAVEVISGREEGYFAYRSINDGVAMDEQLSQWRGLLDLGGASTQITFRPPVIATTATTEEKYTFDVNNESFEIFATSYLPFGLNVAMEKYKENLVSSSPEEYVVVSPCHNPNYEEKYESAHGSRVVTLVGSGDGPSCVSETKQLLYLDRNCRVEGCPTVGSKMGELRGDFYALSAFFYVAYDLGLVGWNDSIVLKPSELSRAGQDFCVKELTPEDLVDSIETQACFQSIYAASILDSYGLDDYMEGNVTFTRKIDGRNADWTMGSLLNAREKEQGRCSDEQYHVKQRRQEG